MVKTRRGLAWHLAAYFGIVSDEPAPPIGTRGWWIGVVFTALAATFAVMAARAFGWLP